MKLQFPLPILLSVFLLISPLSGAGLAQEPEYRTLRRVVVKDSGGQEVASFDGSYALVIGVSNYTGGWRRLPGVKNDVGQVQEALEKRGFQVTMVMDPNGTTLAQELKRFLYKHKENTRLLVYFAGHGHTITAKYNKDKALGYIVPADAPDPKQDLLGFREVAMPMSRIKEFSLNMDARHVLFIFDSCFSGSLFAMTRAKSSEYHILEKTGKPVRQYITSGSGKQEVPDVSIFRAQFIDALKGEGDVNRDGYITGTELGMFLEQNVTNYSERRQTPQYGKINEPNLDKGDFVFLSEKTRKILEPSSSSRVSQGSSKKEGNCDGSELYFNNFVSGSDSLKDCCDYLKEYGEYACKFNALVNKQIERIVEANSLFSNDDPCSNSGLIDDVVQSDPVEEPVYEESVYNEPAYEEPPAVIPTWGSAGSREDDERNFREGNTALAENKYAEALSFFLKAADNGMPEAAKKVGAIYANGLGSAVSRDSVKSKTYYKKALAVYQKRTAEDSAESVDVRSTALYEIATLYRYGQGVERKNLQEAIRWYEKSMALGDYNALLTLAEIHYSGEPGVKKDFQKACELYQQAASIGDAKGQYIYATLLASKECQDEEGLGYNDWYRYSADQGCIKAQVALALAYQVGSDDLPKDLDQAGYWHEQAINNDQATKQDAIDAKIKAARFFREQKFYGKAFDLYQKVIGQGSVTALYDMGMMYMNGESVSVDKKRGMELLKKAADKGHLDALGVVASRYGDKFINNTSDHMLHDPAVYWLEKAEEKGFLQATLYLGLIRLFEQDHEASQMALQYAEQELLDRIERDELTYDDLMALKLLGRLYRAGIGLQKNGKKAQKYTSLSKRSKG